MSQYFSDLIRKAREEHNQTIEIMAMMAGVIPEEYEQFESGILPDNETIDKICQLFQWDYNDIQNKISQHSVIEQVDDGIYEEDSNSVSTNNHNTSTNEELSYLADLLRRAREDVDQTVEALAMMLGVEPGLYLEYEKGLMPDNEFLKRLCHLYGWNYNELQDKLKSTSVAGKNIVTGSATGSNSSRVRLGTLLKDAREREGATLESMAILLNISIDYLAEIERGVTPSDEVLRKISTVFEWNYKDLQLHAKRDSLGDLNVDMQLPPGRYKKIMGQEEVSRLAKHFPEINPHYTLGKMMREARRNEGAEIDGIAILLNISNQELIDIEAGAIPSEEVLKRIAHIFDWNYNDLLLQVKKESFKGIAPETNPQQKPISEEALAVMDLCDQIKEKVEADETLAVETLRVQLELILSALDIMKK